ncbi:hypothetical protein CROQUDRAFT_659220 [Cronartium quercuum f. sp. fusiforme G11]|uniref:Uncharacterized protein n=1 Tax=Cronartium quercuum f. sp. fusiforme G11 TaxID=708437 RepID=A0A9P6TAB3_9BASI|nr:hypothetical protein CROQUDRAFT_659220 [Cronartium quercuum f. sp. fusiforme G11]
MSESEPPTSQLINLPNQVFKTLFQLEPELIPLFLINLGSKQLHLNTLTIVYETLYIEDNSSAFETDQNEHHLTKLHTILYGPQHYSQAVKNLIITKSLTRPIIDQQQHHPKTLERDQNGLSQDTSINFNGNDEEYDTSTTSSESFSLTTSSLTQSPLNQMKQIHDDNQEFELGLGKILSKLINLRSFEWNSDRIPFEGLCNLIGSQCINLETFIVDIITSSHQLSSSTTTKQENWRVYNDLNCGMGGHDHGSILNQWTRQRNQTLEEERGIVETDYIDTGIGMNYSKLPIRWDANGIDSLPSSLITLKISSLSSKGSKNLLNSFENILWSNLKNLNLNNSLFIDDELLFYISTGSKKIKSLIIESMSGTKLTEKGIIKIFQNLDELEEIELIDVEGRFSKTGWLKLEDLPLTLKSIKFGYYEIGSYHSWTLEHLNHILSILSIYPNQLNTLSIKRFVPYPTLIPGKNSIHSDLGLNQRTIPKKMTKEQILEIVNEGQNLKVLEIDWWLISIEGLEVIVKGLPELTKLRVLVDAPFQRIISSTAFVHSKIRTLTVSIPSEHTPSLDNLSSPKNGSPITKTTTTSPNINNENDNLPNIISPVPLRELKKFIKKAGQLREIIWTGRGGLGNYKFTKTCGSAVSVKVEFIPIIEYLPYEIINYEKLQQPLNSPIISNNRRHSSANNQYPRHISQKRRNTSVSHDSRRSSETSLQSLSSSWGHNPVSYLQHQLGVKKEIGLEGIPGTPACEPINDNDCQNQSISIDQQLNHLHLSFA